MFLSPLGRRSVSTISAARQPLAQIWVSNSISPYFNLSFEDWLFRHADPGSALLFVYRDSPCVVIGRNQNPWTEVNHSVLKAKSIPLIRRRSGGGTVYHDLGNVNYSVHTSRNAFNRARSGSVAVNALRSMQIPAAMNDRNDVVVEGYKVSGSAYKIVNNRAYHHGTMLIESDLKSLGSALRSPTNSIVTKGVASVPSPVQNLCKMGLRTITYEAFVRAVCASFSIEYSIPTDSISLVSTATEHPELSYLSIVPEGQQYIERSEAELQTWEWSYGQTPEFTQSLNKSFAWGYVEANIRSKHGIILSCTISSNETDTTSLDSIVGKRYGFLPAHNDSSRTQSETTQEKELYEWLRRETNI